jgi:hypothetical protein
MARLVQSVLALVVLVGFSQAFNISEFKSISKDKGVLDDWIKLEPKNGHTENDTFGLAYGNDKLYMIGKRSNETALSGGIVSTLDKNGDWKHTPFDQLDDDLDQLDIFFTLASRLFLLTVAGNDTIVLNKLFVWDDDQAKWNNITLDIPDKVDVFQKLVRGPHGAISVNVPDSDDKIAYVVLTDHEMSVADSETSFSKLELFMDNSTGMPINASITFIKRVALDTVGKAALTCVVKDGRLYALTATFSNDNTTVNNITIDYAIDLINGSKVDGPRIDASLPFYKYRAGKSIYQSKGNVVFIGPPSVTNGADVDSVTRHIWDLDLAQMKFQDVDAKFPNFPIRAFAIDQKNTRLLTAHPNKGAFAAVINP